MKFLVFFTLVIALSFSSCSPCKNLLQKDEKIGQQFQNFQVKNPDKSSIKYRVKIKALYTREQAILQQAKSCEFADPSTYNYWYGKRLKYSSALENAFLAIEKESQSEKKVSELK